MYTFKKFRTCGSGKRYSGIRVRAEEVTLSCSITAKLANVPRVLIKYNKENAAIAFEPNNNSESYPIGKKNKTTNAIFCALSKVMPQGRYYLEDETGGTLIFVRDLAGLEDD